MHHGFYLSQFVALFLSGLIIHVNALEFQILYDHGTTGKQQKLRY